MLHHGHVTAVTNQVEGSETTADLLTGATVIPVADILGFYESGGSVLIEGDVYAYSAVDDGDESGATTVTLDSGLLADVPAETRVEVWNPNTEAVVSEWKVFVTDDTDGGTGVATLTHTLIALMAAGVPVEVGDSVGYVADEDGSWLVVEIYGRDPGYDPGFIRTGGLGADTVVWAGTEDGRRAQLDGIDGAIEAFNDANEQTVNIDGETNYIEGTLATAASGPRVEIGAGTGLDGPVHQVQFLTGEAAEVEPGSVGLEVVDLGAIVAIQEMAAPKLDAGTGPPLVRLTSSSAGEASVVIDAGTSIAMETDGAVIITAGSGVDATMRNGSVGDGPFRDSVDARVTAVAPGAVPAASETVAGKAELATQAETDTGTDDARIVTPLKLATAVPAASTTAAGKVELATTAEALTGTDTARAVTPEGVKAVADLKGNLRKTINDQTGTSYTLVLSDEDKVVQVDNAGTHTLTVPTNASVAFPIGSEVEVVRTGAGAVNIAADSGVTIHSRSSFLSISARYGTVRLRKRFANTWLLSGDLA
jgi:hypothetical protein